MSIPNPEHLLQQAERLIQPTRSGAPRQVDLRRAISSAYYGVFHAVLRGAADQITGASRRVTMEYGRIYQSIEHRHVRELCIKIKKSVLTPKYKAHAPMAGFDSNMIAFATGFIDLQASRHSADYDPLIRFSGSDVAAMIQTARASLSSFTTASVLSRNAFLSLLIFPPRR